MDLKAEALELAEAGVRVFPLDEHKRPRTKHGFHDATTDRGQIERWDWSGAIGASIDEGTFVVDIDPRNGGDNTRKALTKAGCDFPVTKVHRTKNGGTHRFYALPPDLVGKRLRGTLGPGIDVKAAGRGYVVVPPSPGYAVQYDRKPAVAPAWMLDELVAPEVDREAVASAPKFFPWEEGTVYGRKALESEIGRLLMTEEGGRNNALNRAAFALAQLHAGGHISEAECLSRLELAGERMGLEPREIEITVQSGWRAGLEEPRQPGPMTAGTNGPEQGFNLVLTPRETVALLGSPADEARFWLDWQNADDSPPPFYLDPIIPKNAYVLVYGATEASKSMVLLALACQASQRGIRSSIYSLENPSHIDIDRVRRLGPDPDYFRITNEMLDLNDARQVHSLAAREQSWPGGKSTDWLILDTYSHAFNSRTEDGNAKAIEFARRIRWVMHEVGCSVLLVDHTGYADHGEPRDASAKRQQVDVAIKMARPDGWKWEPGQDSAFTMENMKSARFANPFFLVGRICDAKDGSRALHLEWNKGQTPPKWEE